MKHILSISSCLALLLIAGCDEAADTTSQENSAEFAEFQKQREAQKQMAAENPQPEKDGKGIIGKTTAEVVDARKALEENPDLQVHDRRGLGSNPLSQSTNAYVYLRSQVSTLGMQQSINAHKALNDSWPTYEEFMKIMTDNRIEFTQLYRWQKYGYDSETGEIMILQDEELKKEMYKAKGLDYEKSDL